LRLDIKQERVDIPGLRDVARLFVCDRPFSDDILRLAGIGDAGNFPLGDFLLEQFDTGVVLVCGNFQHLSLIAVPTGRWIECGIDRRLGCLKILRLNGNSIDNAIRSVDTVGDPYPFDASAPHHICKCIIIFRYKPMTPSV